MKLKKFLTKTSVIGVAMGAMLSMGVLVACGDDTESPGGQETGGAEGSGEHGAAGEAGGERGGGGEEASGTMLALDETFDTVRSGARLMMRYDAPSNSFTGTVENTTNSVLTRVRIEVHLSNGVELGPTTPVDLSPGEVIAVALPATPEPFTGWTPHAEVGSGEGGGAEGNESGGEGPESGGEGGAEGPEGSPEGGGAELNEAAMSSPIIPLSQTWEGNLGGLAISARYDTATQTVYSTVENTTSQVLCYVQAEPHLKSGTTTVGELGPDVLGHLSPGQAATSAVAVSSEPSLAGVSFDGYVVHMEIFDCAGSGPVPHTGGEGGEGGGGEGAGGEGHGPGGEGGAEGSETGSSGGEEGSGNMLALNETFDTVRAGARLILNYDPSTNSFKGTVENTTNNTLTRVRIEVHLSNGTELGPTTPVDMAPGQVLAVNLPATAEPFTGWVPHAEVGSGEGGGEHGSSGEGSGEHGSGGEHGSSGEGSGG